MSTFTLLDWIIAGIILIAGLGIATIKALFYDDSEIRSYIHYKKNKSKR